MLVMLLVLRTGPLWRLQLWRSLMLQAQAQAMLRQPMGRHAPPPPLTHKRRTSLSRMP